MVVLTIGGTSGAGARRIRLLSSGDLNPQPLDQQFNTLTSRLSRAPSVAKGKLNCLFSISLIVNSKFLKSYSSAQLVHKLKLHLDPID